MAEGSRSMIPSAITPPVAIRFIDSFFIEMPRPARASSPADSPESTAMAPTQTQMRAY